MATTGTGGNTPPQLEPTMGTGGNTPPGVQTVNTGGNTPPQVQTMNTGGNTPPIQIMDWQSRLAQGNTTALNRNVQGNELVENRLNDLTASDSRYIQQARDRARNEASGRGMMMSSTAAGAGVRAAIDAGLPIAQADAARYGSVYDANMAATNADRMADQNMHGNLVGQEVGIRANLDEADRNRGWQTGERTATQAWQTGERTGAQQYQTGERLGTQTWQSGENAASREHTTSERLGTQSFQAAEAAAGRTWQGTQNDLQRLADWNNAEANRQLEEAMKALDRDFNGTQNDKQLVQQRFIEFNNSMVQMNTNLTNTLAAIYNNPNLTAAQQQAAAENARAVHQSLFNSYAASLSNGLPQIFWQPYAMPGAQPATNPTPNTTPPPAPPPSPNGGGAPPPAPPTNTTPPPALPPPTTTPTPPPPVTPSGGTDPNKGIFGLGEGKGRFMVQ